MSHSHINNLDANLTGKVSPSRTEMQQNGWQK